MQNETRNTVLEQPQLRRALGDISQFSRSGVTVAMSEQCMRTTHGIRNSPTHGRFLVEILNQKSWNTSNRSPGQGNQRMEKEEAPAKGNICHIANLCASEDFSFSSSYFGMKTFLCPIETYTIIIFYISFGGF